MKLHDNEYDPLIYGVEQVEGIDHETLSLFTSATDSNPEALLEKLKM